MAQIIRYSEIELHPNLHTLLAKFSAIRDYKNNVLKQFNDRPEARRTRDMKARVLNNSRRGLSSCISHSFSFTRCSHPELINEIPNSRIEREMRRRNFWQHLNYIYNRTYYSRSPR